MTVLNRVMIMLKPVMIMLMLKPVMHILERFVTMQKSFMIMMVGIPVRRNPYILFKQVFGRGDCDQPVEG